MFRIRRLQRQSARHASRRSQKLDALPAIGTKAVHVTDDRATAGTARRQRKIQYPESKLPDHLSCRAHHIAACRLAACAAQAPLCLPTGLRTFSTVNCGRFGATAPFATDPSCSCTSVCFKIASNGSRLSAAHSSRHSSSAVRIGVGAAGLSRSRSRSKSSIRGRSSPEQRKERSSSRTNGIRRRKLSICACRSAPSTRSTTCRAHCN